MKPWIIVIGMFCATPARCAGPLAATGDTWPIARGDSALSGTTQARIPEKPVLRWRHNAGSKLLAAPVIQTGMVYVAGSDGVVQALRLADGAPIWTFKAEAGIEASPLLADGGLYVGDLDGRLHALDPATGHRRWTATTEGQILGGPNWAPGPPALVLVGSYDNRLHTFDAATGARVWAYETANYVNGIPAIGDGVALVGGCDERVHIVALSNGVGRAAVPAGSYVAASPAVRGNQAYVGHYQGEVLGLDIVRGSVLWRFRPESAPPFYASVAATATRVLAASRQEGVVYALSRADGRLVWSHRAGGGIDSAPVVADDRVVIGSQDGRVSMLRFDTGEQVWSYLVGSPVSAPTAVVDGWIVAVAEDGGVSAFGEAPSR